MWRRKEDSWAVSASQSSGTENPFSHWTQSPFDTYAQLTVLSDRTKKGYFNWALPFAILPVQPLKLTVVTERRPALEDTKMSVRCVQIDRSRGTFLQGYPMTPPLHSGVQSLIDLHKARRKGKFPALLSPPRSQRLSCHSSSVTPGPHATQTASAQQWTEPMIRR